MNKTKKNKIYFRMLLPAVLVALLVLDGLLGYVAPDPYEGLDLGGQTAYAAETPELELEEADAVKTVSKGPAGKLGAVAESGEYSDGTYTGVAKGFGGLIKVKVVIKDGKIVSIQIVSAAGETGSYLSRASAVTGRIIKAQSTNVDAVSGATYSSNGIIKAVRNALAKAEVKKKTSKKKQKDSDDQGSKKKKDPEKPEVITDGEWTDGTYTGEGEGFSGKLHVTVTIEDGKITAIELTDSKDDPEFMGKAQPSIFDAVIKSQSTDVDAVTGATYSSYGLLQAINDALSKAADESGGSGGSGGSGTDPGDEDPDKTYKDGTYTSTVACTREGWFDYDVIVTLTVSDGRLSQLSVVKGEDFTGNEDDEADNDYYLDLAANGSDSRTGMIERILSAQSADVDAVSGATFSSRAIKSAVAGILADIATETETEAKETTKSVMLAAKQADELSEETADDEAVEEAVEETSEETNEDTDTEEVTQSESTETEQGSVSESSSSQDPQPADDSSNESSKKDQKQEDKSAVIPDNDESDTDS